MTVIETMNVKRVNIEMKEYVQIWRIISMRVISIDESVRNMIEKWSVRVSMFATRWF